MTAHVDAEVSITVSMAGERENFGSSTEVPRSPEAGKHEAPKIERNWSCSELYFAQTWATPLWEHLKVKTVVFARWEVEADSAKTRELYSSLKAGSPETCGCALCRNFVAARPQIYPAEFTRLCESLGIDRDREAEVYHTHRAQPGRHHYGGWVHFVGRIVSGSDAAKPIGTNAWTFELEKINAEFEFGFTNKVGLLRDSFKEQSIVQVEFRAVAPWVLLEEEPER
jgi:hypothetical protein